LDRGCEGIGFWIAEVLQMVDEPAAAIASDQILDKLHRRFPKSRIILTMGSNGSAYTDGKIRKQKVTENGFRAVVFI